MPNLPRRLSITDINPQPFSNIRQGNLNTTFWWLSPDEIVFQPDNFESHDIKWSQGNIRAELSFNTIIDLTLKQILGWESDRHKYLKKVGSLGFRQSVCVDIRYGDEPHCLIGVCEHVLRYMCSSRAFAAIIRGYGSWGEVLSVTSTLHHEEKTAGRRDRTVYGLVMDG